MISHLYFFLGILALGLIGGQATAATGAGITYHGRLIDPSGNPVVGSNVQFRLQIRTPGNENCLMYEEVQNKDLSLTNGVYAVTINDGTGSRLDTTGFSLDQIFANRNSFSFAGGNCTAGNTYSPNPTDSRKIQVLFNDGTFPVGQWEPMAPMAINFVPMAIESIQVGGYKKEQLLKIADGVSTTGTELNSSSWTELLALLGGTTTQYVKSGSANFTAAPTWNGVPSGANDLVNKTYVDAQVAAGLPNVGSAGTYTKVTTDAKGRVTTGTNLGEADIPTLSTAGKVAGSAINAGTLGGSTAINSSGNLVTTGTVQGAILSGTNIRAYNGANYVQLAAPALGSNLNLSLPAADGAAGTLMKTNGSGQLSFAALSASDVPNLDAGIITTGTMPVGRGGTGQTSYGNNSVLVSNAAGNGFNSLNCTLGQVVKFDVSGFAGCGSDSTGSGSQWTTTASDIYYNTGKVGIGTATPAGILDVQGGTSTVGAGQGINLVAQSALTWSGTYYPGGSISITAGNSFGEGINGGSVQITAGKAQYSGAIGDGGSLSLSGSSHWGNPGGATLSGGVGRNGYGYAGNLYLNTSTSSAGAPAYLVAGNAYSGNSNGGPLYLFGGYNAGAGVPGNTILAHNGTSGHGNVGIGTTTPAAKLQVSGEAIVGESGLACSVTTKGAIRYNNASSVLEFCNGTSWNLIQAAACSDATPNVISFADEANATLSSLYNSDIQLVNGINCSVPVTISGQGSPQFQICSDSSCTTVLQGWTSSPSSISNGQYLQTRLTTDSVGGSQFQATIIVGSAATVWSVTSTGGDCTAASPAVGTVCADGTIYAGLSPDGSVKMYSPRCDLGQSWNGSICIGSRTNLPWNSGVGASIQLYIFGIATGKANSLAISLVSNAESPYAAAQNCENLIVHGNSDWYLPSIAELNILYSNKGAVRNFSTSRYWSSSEYASDNAKYIDFSNGGSGDANKAAAYPIRCVRR